jgi:hypothetical protein
MSAHKKKITKLPVEGCPRPYLRDGVPGLPIERQREMLEALGLDLSDDASLYIDRISRKRASGRPHLAARDEAVTPPHPWQTGETVYIASLRVLGWDHLDVVRAAAKAFEKECRIYCADTGSVYSAETPATELLNALARSEEARRRERTRRAKEGQLSRQAKRMADGLPIARREWAGPLSVSEIEEMSKISRRTLYTKFGPRSEAREVKKRGKRHE